MDSTDNSAIMTIDLRRSRFRVHKSTLNKMGMPQYVQFLVNPEEMFPTHAQNDLSAVGEQAAVLHESANLDAGADAQARQHSVHIPASWAVGYLREEQASP